MYPAARNDLHFCAPIDKRPVFDQTEIADDLVYWQVRIDAFKSEYMFVSETLNPNTRSVAGLQF